jgi:hypothetical protein
MNVPCIFHKESVWSLLARSTTGASGMGPRTLAATMREWPKHKERSDHVFYAQGVEAKVLVFGRGIASKMPWTECHLVQFRDSSDSGRWRRSPVSS